MTTFIFYTPKIAALTQTVCHYIVTANQPVLVLPSRQMFSAGLPPLTLQALPVVMVVNCLAWWNKFLMINDPPSQNTCKSPARS
jgi:hypothetical protein